MRALWDASWRRKTRICPIERDPSSYDLLILGGPIWAKHLAAPVRTFAEHYRQRAKHIAFFCTEGGSGADVAFRDLERLAAQLPVATLIVDAKHLNPTDHRSDLGRFIAIAMRVGDEHVDTSEAPKGVPFGCLVSDLPASVPSGPR